MTGPNSIPKRPPPPRSRPDGPCPLCGSDRPYPFHLREDRSGRREFYLCPVCELVFVPPGYHPNPDEERERYLQHDNNPSDPRYRAFLSRLFDELKPYLRPGAKGLDFGAGPGPALAQMMAEAGFRATVYDPIFFPDTAALEDRYDFVTCTETAEHFRDPGRQFRLLDRLLRAPAWLGVMTSMLDDPARFPGWYYHRDPTHLCFYTPRTMTWIAERHNWQPIFPRKNVVLFRKPA